MARIDITGGDQTVGNARRVARTVALQYDSVMADLTTNYAGLTAAAKLEAVRQGVILALRILKYMWLRSEQ